MSNPKLIVSDVTLRDGNHAVAQKLDFRHAKKFLHMIDESGVDWIEIGHGNGLGASSANFGYSAIEDEEMIEICRSEIKRAKVAVHVMPGIATFSKNVKPAIELGVDVFRVGAHCTEADTTQRMIEKIKDRLKDYRSAGLEREGEYSYENLVFKFLRRNGYLSKLEDFKNKITDKKLSLEQEIGE